jgi:pimeloyl-ACP methyl ester carboxylesterase
MSGTVLFNETNRRHGKGHAGRRQASFTSANLCCKVSRPVGGKTFDTPGRWSEDRPWLRAVRPALPAPARILGPGMPTLRVPVDVGDGAPIVILHGFAMTPAIYRRTALLLSRRARVVVPDLFAVRGPWRYELVLSDLVQTLDEMGLDRVTMIGHSFGGGLELAFAASQPSRVVELVFSDTLAVSREWGLADEALRHPLRLLRLATPAAASAFGRTLALHPRQLAEAGWWGFRSAREDHIGSIAEAGIPSHVLWAGRDSILARSDGQKFADELNASFTVATGTGTRPVDHDWMFQQPELFVRHLENLGIQALVPRRKKRAGSPGP